MKTLQSELSALFNHAVRFYELKSNPVVKAVPLGKAYGGVDWTDEGKAGRDNRADESREPDVVGGNDK